MGRTQANAFIGKSERETATQLLGIVTPIAKKYGLLPSVATAQCILESGYCKTDLALNANNVCGMKCSLSGNTWEGSTWDGRSKYTKRTAEDDGKGNLYYITADFRSYPTVEDSIADRCAYLLGARNGSEKRYKGIQDCKDYKSQVQLIKNGGYATDTKYVDKICSIIERFDLAVNDAVEEPVEEKPAVIEKPAEQKETQQADADTTAIKINTQYITTNNSNQNNDPKYIVIHNTDNFKKGADALAHASGLYNGYMQGMSWHYVTDDHSIYQCLPHRRGAWHVGVNYGSNNMYGTVNNRNSICIEMCVNAGYDYEKAFLNTVALTKYLMKQLNIPADRVVTHKMVCSKECPSQILARGDWPRFKKLLGSADVPTPTPASDPARNYLMMGDTGEAVKTLQTMLNACGFDCGAVDGDFGLKTETALRHFQKREALAIDGLYGPASEAALKAMYAQQTAKPEQGIIYRVQTGAYKYSTLCKQHLKEVHEAGFTDAFMTLKRVDNFYRVQVGAYTSKANAEAMVKRVKKAGFDAIIKEYKAE